ncbi:MAG: MarR family transcriptional regulator [Methanobrevibacter sp.]|uniref:MarR family transcriptional regulator n=1 Tax=Methanobrevibacter sp. TaxID=66852 RepID=UPI0025F43E7E|nr:helix-turn-helix domain-containing protein [Methanobrevibacter sp.]MBR3113320.1 MarR family transcriptional regulator [Methanobrevibacter sp.]MBR6993366.1 MarR family transcriptional regulator [Methanobrevibacter sp.]
MKNSEMYKILGYVKVSPYRTNTLITIGNDLMMPSEIAKKLDINTSQVSSALSDLKEKNLVVCVNEEVRKGRLYKCTDLGLEIIKKL